MTHVPADSSSADQVSPVGHREQPEPSGPGVPTMPGEFGLAHEPAVTDEPAGLSVPGLRESAAGADAREAASQLAAADLAAGLGLRTKRRLTAAVALFERAVATSPALADAWFWLAVTRDNLGQQEAAIPAYRRALQLGIADTERRAQAQMWLASSLSKTGQHEAALAALAAADRLGGYEPAGEYIRLRRAIWRRSAPPRRPVASHDRARRPRAE
jgi:tetratricopeptide (TPR) repeat protein